MAYEKIIMQARIDELNSILDRVWEIADELNELGLIDTTLILSGVSDLRRAASYANEKMEDFDND